MATLRSAVWGNKPVEIYQDFGVIPDDPEMRSWYDYAKYYGMPAGTHIGIDIGVELGTPIYALNAGVIEKAGFDPDNFRPMPVTVVTKDDPNTIDDEGGYKEIYGHLWTNTVSTGQQVSAGQQLGSSGQQTYRGTWNPDGSGEHLHFELLEPGANTVSGYQARDPKPWLQKKGIDPKPAPDDEPDESGDSGLPSLPDIGGIGSLINGVLQQGAFVLIGLAVLAVGLIAVLNSGGNSGGIARKVKKVIPATRVVDAARKAIRN